MDRELLFIERFLGLSARDRPFSELRNLTARAAYMREIEVGIVQEAVVRAFGG